ncbi:MAG TPA: GNAT family N-acetyltransferase [Rhodanobacteraceae bacterium]|nr:GNAT family N-acetyltransferase [Rhodanobacteraceae bacterium]
MSDAPCRIRLAEADDEQFILGLADRFVGFELPPWRKRNECANGIRQDLLRHLDESPPNSFIFVAEDDDGARVGFLHLQKARDFFTGKTNCHVSDLATTPEAEGRGIGRAMLDFVEAWAREHRCQLITLAVFPGNQRARALYDSRGYATDLLRLAKPVT